MFLPENSPCSVHSSRPTQRRAGEGWGSLPWQQDSESLAITAQQSALDSAWSSAGQGRGNSCCTCWVKEAPGMYSRGWKLPHPQLYVLTWSHTVRDKRNSPIPNCLHPFNKGSPLSLNPDTPVWEIGMEQQADVLLFLSWSSEEGAVGTYSLWVPQTGCPERNSLVGKIFPVEWGISFSYIRLVSCGRNLVSIWRVGDSPSRKQMPKSQESNFCPLRSSPRGVRCCREVRSLSRSPCCGNNPAPYRALCSLSYTTWPFLPFSLALLPLSVLSCWSSAALCHCCQCALGAAWSMC